MPENELRGIRENTRITIYLVLVSVGVLQCVLPIEYLCNHMNVSCPLCGIRQAIDFILVGKIGAAIDSNPLIVVIVVIAVCMIVDAVFILTRRLQAKKQLKGTK